MKKIIVSVSGGKDSTATLIKAIKEYGKDNVMGVFCDTGWEHPQTYEYIDYLREKLQVEIKTLRNEKFNSVIDLIKHKKIFPSPMRRFCSEYLKLKPMINFLIELSSNPNIEIENWIGIRSNESRSRNERYGHLSSNDILSYNDMYSLTKKQAASLKNVKLRFPVVNLTANDVYKIIINAGLDINKLYYQGQSRVGCYPCILSSIGSFKSVWQDKIGKERILYLRELENELNKNNEFKTTLKPGLSAQELVRRLENNDLQIEMFEPEYVCSFCNI
jgi:3'-phosphoadenosine 5'-phosphosulfate sulfotransferase (PAPS reductase)/FAD synthetase